MAKIDKVASRPFIARPFLQRVSRTRITVAKFYRRDTQEGFGQVRILGQSERQIASIMFRALGMGR